MNDTASYRPFEPEVLPSAIAAYLAAQADPATRRDVGHLFAPDARVVDEGIEYPGIEAIRTWLATAASAYSYTTTFTGQQGSGGRWVIRGRLEGTFPGGVADLRYTFTVSDAGILDLVIAP